MMIFLRFFFWWLLEFFKRRNVTLIVHCWALFKKIQHDNISLIPKDKNRHIGCGFVTLDFLGLHEISCRHSIDTFLTLATVFVNLSQFSVTECERISVHRPQTWTAALNTPSPFWLSKQVLTDEGPVCRPSITLYTASVCTRRSQQFRVLRFADLHESRHKLAAGCR